MKRESVYLFLLMLIIFTYLNSLGCLEYTEQLSSDFTPIEKDTYSLVNDSNLSVSYICEYQKVNMNLGNQYTIRGNITNIGSSNVYFPKVTAAFFKKNGTTPEFNNDIDSERFRYIKPNQAVEFVIEKQYPIPTTVESYKIIVSY